MRRARSARAVNRRSRAMPIQSAGWLEARPERGGKLENTGPRNQKAFPAHVAAPQPCLARSKRANLPFGSWYSGNPAPGLSFLQARVKGRSAMKESLNRLYRAVAGVAFLGLLVAAIAVAAAGQGGTPEEAKAMVERAVAAVT